jgi:iron-sulfur cluster assembly accessory protein
MDYITLTDEAAAKIREVMTENEWHNAGLRFGLQDGGCSGYTYQIDFEEAPEEDDLVVEQHGVRVFIHPLHLPFLEGATIGYKRERFQEGFDIVNPHAKRFCGCGESFDV